MLASRKGAFLGHSGSVRGQNNWNAVCKVEEEEMGEFVEDCVL